MKRIAVSFALLLLVASFLPTISTQAGQGPPCRQSLADCPDGGCGGGDPELNKKKNRTADASSPEGTTLGRIRAFSEPERWTNGQERSSLASREDRAVVVRAYLHDARQSGPETTNCRIRGADNNDWHLDLVSFKNAIRQTAVTAEITPRLRKSGWTIQKLNRLERDKAYVRVTGWLMLDTQHLRRPLRRSTNWEIHPITKFEVCTSTITDCRNGNGWQDLEDFNARN